MRDARGSCLVALATIAGASLGAPSRWGIDPLASASAGNTLRETSSAYAAANNPALLGVEDRPAFGIGLTAASFAWGALGNVVVDSPEFRVEDGRLRRADVPAREAGVTALSLGLRVPIRAKVRWLPPMGLGVTASGPVSTLRQFRASSPYDFAPLRYGTSDTQFKATVGLSAAVFRGFSVGAGVDVFVTAAGNADVAVGGREPVGRFAMDVGWNTAAVLGAYWRDERTSVGFVYRQRIQPRLRQDLVGVVAVGGADVAALPLELAATLYGEPETYDLEVGRRTGKWTIAASVRWERWRGVETSALAVRAHLPGGNTRRTRSDVVRLDDVLSPAASIAYALDDRWSLGAGYRWSPSPVSDRSGIANTLDAGTHVVGLGVSQKLGAGAIVPCPVRWSFGLERHWAESVSVTKARADAVGAPGYVLSGSGLGVHAGLELAL